MSIYNDLYKTAPQHKRAGVAADVLGSIPATAAATLLSPYDLGLTTNLTGLAGTTGLVHGAVIGAASDKDIVEMSKNPAKSLIPGVGASRLLRRLRNVANDTRGGEGTANLVGEHFGTATSILAAAALGGAATIPLGGIGAIPAGLAAAGISSLGGPLTALLTKTRDKKSQSEHDKDWHLADWLVPGVAQYNYWKRVGRAREKDQTLMAAHEKEQQKKKNESTSAPATA